METPATEETFEVIVERLRTVVEQLEGGDLPLSRSLEIFEEGVRLSRLGVQRLDEAEHRVEQLLAHGEEVSTRSMDREELG
ncbi:MAG: exodeoxyribonuclease VII small subunit [Myxococcota bacterium]